MNGTRIVPGVTVLDLVLAAGATAEPAVAPGAARLRHVVWARPLTVTGDELSAELRLTRTPDGYDFAVLGADGTRCAAGRLSTGETRPDRIDLAALRERYPAPLDVAEGYAALRASGIVHGPALRGMREVRRGDDGILARIEVPAGTSTGWYLNPAILDSALQAALAVGAGSGGWRRPDAVAMPFALDELTVCAATPGTVTAVFREVPAGPASKVDVDLYAEDGSTVARLRGYTSRPSSDGAGTGGRTRPADGDLIEVRQVWREAAPASTGVPGTLVLLNAALDDRSARDVADRLDAELLPLPAPVPGTRWPL